MLIVNDKMLFTLYISKTCSMQQVLWLDKVIQVLLYSIFAWIFSLVWVFFRIEHKTG